MMPARLREAVKLAWKERFRDKRGYSLAAVGLRGDAVVRATNILSLGIDASTHAECRCLRKMGHGGIMFVARVRKDGSVGNAKPCGGCALAARHKGVRIVYTINDNSWGTLDA